MGRRGDPPRPASSRTGGARRPSLPGMAAAQGHLTDENGAPLVFRQAVEALLAARVRPEVELAPMPAPKRLAPYAYALEAAVLVEGEELADGRLVLLHDPAGQEAWHGVFRVVTLARAELEPEMAADPLLPEVCWSWLTGALEARGRGLRGGGRYRLAQFLALLRRAGRPGRHHADRGTGLVDAARHGGRVPGRGGAPDRLVRAAVRRGRAAARPGEQGAEGVVSLPNRRGPR